MISVIHLTHSISRLGGGLFESVRHLSRSVNRNGIHLEILALRDAGTNDDAPLWRPIETRVHCVIGPSQFGYAPSMSRDLLSRNASLLHLHGLWKYPSVAASNWARRTKRPLIVSPHGMLEPWALGQSRFRKRAAMWLYQRECLRRAYCIRATSKMELESIRSAGFQNAVAMIPNGVEMPPAAVVRSGNSSNPIRTALFLSRVHRKKGLLNLIEAWARVAPRDWRLAIAGPDEGGHLAEVQQAVARRRLQDRVQFLPECWGAARWQYYRDADLFVLPSYSENFGLVIAEALACGVPVITTRATPWAELEQERCGWWIDTGVEALVAVLRIALSMSPEALHAMGERGNALVNSRYSWVRIGSLMVEAIEWMLDRRSAPAFVHFT